MTLATKRQKVTIAPAALPNAVAKQPYSGGPLNTYGPNGPYTLRVTQGSLPFGVHLDGSEGSLSGVPLSPGIFEFTISTYDKYGRYVGFRDFYGPDAVIVYPSSETQAADMLARTASEYLANRGTKEDTRMQQKLALTLGIYDRLTGRVGATPGGPLPGRKA